MHDCVHDARLPVGMLCQSLFISPVLDTRICRGISHRAVTCLGTEVSPALFAGGWRAAQCPMYPGQISL